MENKENLISSNNYCNDTGKNLKALQTKSLKNEKLIENNCSKCGENVQATYNYCNNCGAAKEVIGSKSGIKNIDFTKKELPDFKVPEIKSVGSIDIIYILKAVGIISLIGLLTGLLLTVLVLLILLVSLLKVFLLLAIFVVLFSIILISLLSDSLLVLYIL